MKTLIALILAMILVWITAFSYAQASFNCGIKPILPIGCKSAVCSCDNNGNCRWVFIC